MILTIIYQRNRLQLITLTISFFKFKSNIFAFILLRFETVGK